MSANNLKTTKAKTFVTKKVSLEGINLRIEVITFTYNVIVEMSPEGKPLRLVSKKQINEKAEALDFNLKEVTPEEIANFRKNGVPSFILKLDGKLFHTVIPRGINLMPAKFLGSHQCSHAGTVCNRLSASPDTGCEKVRMGSSYLELYPWITKGYETFNALHDCFVVINCSHYEDCPPRKHLNADRIDSAKLSLAQYILGEEVKDLSDIKLKL